MEMERINENTIRVFIESEDLAARGITVLDLLNSQKQIETLFYSILEEVDLEEQFQDSDSVTFQVIPNRRGLELFITKNANMPDVIGFKEPENPAEMREFAEMIRKQVLDEENYGLNGEAEDAYEKEVLSHFVLVFSSFDDLVLMAKEVYLENVETAVYHYQEKYFLAITFLGEERAENDTAYLLEFAKKSHVTLELLEEYGQLVMEGNALEQLRYYFK